MKVLLLGVLRPKNGLGALDSLQPESQQGLGNPGKTEVQISPGGHSTLLRSKAP